MNNAVIYCRVSTKDQVDNFSLAIQEKWCRDYCARNGFNVNKVFVEEGESAKTEKRTEFQRMLAYCQENKGKVKWVVVYGVSRFSRSLHVHSATRAFLAALGISLRSATEVFDESSQGKFIESLMASIAQFENDARGERTVVGMKAAIESGKWPFKAPLGFLNSNGKEGRGSLVPDPVRAPLVRQAFELYATGLHTMQDVLKIVTAAGLRTRKGKPVPKQTLNQLLRKPVFAGWIEVPGWSERTRGDFEPIVTENVFETVQARLSGKRVSLAPRLRSNPDFPLRHFVKCGCCGKPLTASWSKGRTERYPYYRCPNKNCAGLNVRKVELEGRFSEYLERLQPKQSLVNLFNAIVVDVWKEKQAQSLALSVTLHQRIKNLHERKEKLEEAFLYEKAIDRETYDRQRDKLNEEILLAEMAEQDAKLEGYDIDAVLSFAGHVMANAARLWTEVSSEQKQRLQTVLFPKGVTFVNGEFGTTETSPLFSLLLNSEAEKSSLATLTLTSWNQLVASLREFHLLKDSAFPLNQRASKTLRSASCRPSHTSLEPVLS